MDLSVESCNYRLCQIDKIVKIFENVAFSGSHFLKVYIYCKLETYLFLTMSLLVIVEGLDGGSWYSLITKNLAIYSLSLKIWLIH